MQEQPNNIETPEEIIDANIVSEDDPFDGEPLLAPDGNEDDLNASFADFFGDIEPEDDEVVTPAPVAVAEVPAADAPVVPVVPGDIVDSRPPVAETPAVPAAPTQEEDAVPLNHLGLPDISDEEWTEYLADESIPDRNRHYLDYQLETQKRQVAYDQRLNEARTKEVADTRQFVEKSFGERSKEILPGIEDRVNTILGLLPANQRNTPGYHALATRLVIADQLPQLLASGIAPADVSDTPAPAPAATKPAKANPAGRVVAVESGSSAPATPSRQATAEIEAGKQLTNDERTFAKSLGMTYKEYLENK